MSKGQQKEVEKVAGGAKGGKTKERWGKPPRERPLFSFSKRPHLRKSPKRVLKHSIIRGMGRIFKGNLGIVV
jgi:hypothetical protein